MAGTATTKIIRKKKEKGKDLTKNAKTRINEMIKKNKSSSRSRNKRIL
jgi:hypothetical protein